MTKESREHVKATSAKGQAAVSGPEVLAVFVADCKATMGHGSTVAVVQGGSGRCRLYGKDSLANAFPEQNDICRTLTSANKMGEHFKVPVVVGKEACVAYMTERKLQFAGSEVVLADKGKGHKRAGGFRQTNYQAF